MYYEGVFLNMLDKKNIIKEEEPAVLVGLVQKDQTETQVQEYLDELAFLTETAGAKNIKRFLHGLLYLITRAGVPTATA